MEVLILPKPASRQAARHRRSRGALLSYHRACTFGIGAWGFLWAWCLWELACPLPALAQPSREYEIKAVFLFKLAQFVEWPPEAFESKTSPLVIGVLGTDPFGSFLDDTVRNETFRGRPFAVKRCQRLEEIKSCHILYIGQSEAERVNKILDAAANYPVLTVSDIDDVAFQGIMIRFINERNRIRLRIDSDAAKTARLTLSSKLLRTAEVVGKGK